jgi:regulator of sirC expression with transglutaminase-like and TPR domain
MNMPTPQEARRLFSRIVRMPDQEIDLVEAALLIAARQGSGVPTELCLAQLAAIAHRAQALLRSEGIEDPRLAPCETVDIINRVLFHEEGFTGNRDDYYDIDNSYLDRVLARRTGIPITLSIVYMEVARQVGLPMQGIGLPGHFVVGYWPAGRGRLPKLIVDPFNEGQLLSWQDCAARIQAAYGADAHFTFEWLRPMSNRQILARVLGNLKQIYMSLEQRQEALRTIDMLLIVQPDATWELKERGLLYFRMGSFVLALADLRRCLKLSPKGEESFLLKYHIDLLRRLISSNN